MKIDKNNLGENLWMIALIAILLVLICVSTQCINAVDVQDTPETRVEATETHETVETDIPEDTEIDIVTEAPADTEELAEIETVETEKLVEIEDVEIEETEPEETIPEPVEIEVEYPKLYTDYDAIALAKMVWGEARGMGDLWTWRGTVSGKAQQAACIWTVLNRYDAGFGNSIIDILSAPHQYAGYNSSYPVEAEYLELARDVLDRWNREKHGETDVGRVIPSDYFWFRGDGKHNYFRNEFDTRRTWDWRLEDPYKEG